jgi:LysM repeat protein
VRQKTSIRWFFALVLLTATLNSAAVVRAADPLTSPAQPAEVSAYDLIVAMNTLRVSNGLPALVEDAIINAVAQSTAEIMAANLMSWHIGDVSGRLAAAGYGGGAKVWATENFAVGDLSLNQIMVIWSDASHMIPAVNPAYCHVGAGIAKASNGRTYYVLQAAYTSTTYCGEYKAPDDNTDGITDGSTDGGVVSQWIVPVEIATPDEEGQVYHVVEAGQTLWAIAIAYEITIEDLETWNNLSRDSKLQIGQSLYIPGTDTEGYNTPTPIGMVQLSTPDPDGKIVHTVQAYQTLTTIAQAYGIDIETILALNGIQVDWPLRIGQELVINLGSVTPSPTPRPLTPIEKLTPANDGAYYHFVKTNETLSWIAVLYEVKIADLMAWNGLNGSSILQPDQKLILHVTPPATETPTPSSATPTSTTTAAQTTPTPLLLQTQTGVRQDAKTETSSAEGSATAIWAIAIGLLAVGTFLAVFFTLKKPE